jgi:hypothetical protein
MILPNGGPLVLRPRFGRGSAMQKDWGSTGFVEYAGKRIVFDAGNDLRACERIYEGVSMQYGLAGVVPMTHPSHWADGACRESCAYR